MEIKLPKLGEGADSGTVVSILVKVGDRIKNGQTLLELENEKAVAPIPSTADGVITQILVKEGQKIAAGTRLFVVESGSEVASTQPAAAAAPVRESKPPRATPPAAAPVEPQPVIQSVPEPAFSEPRPDAEVAAAPSIRKIARELGIDLTRIRGSERGGRIVMKDVKAYIEKLQQLAFSPKPSPPSMAANTASTAAAMPAEAIDFSQWGEVNLKPMSSLRKIISRRMHESWSAIPHVTQFDEADITRLMELRKKLSAAYEAKGARLTLTPFTLKAVVSVLKQNPIFNASLNEASDEIVYKQYYHIGMAVDTEAGLIVPVIRDVDKKSLYDLSKELQDLAERTRARKVSAEELKGGTFTISNQGGIGGAHFTPIINRPEVAILGLGRSILKPVVRQDKIEPRTLMPLCLSYDHRLIDGGSAARFIVQLVAALEQFDESEASKGV